MDSISHSISAEASSFARWDFGFRYGLATLIAACAPGFLEAHYLKFPRICIPSGPRHKRDSETCDYLTDPLELSLEGPRA
jgi:hypothetical protein